MDRSKERSKRSSGSFSEIWKAHLHHSMAFENVATKGVRIIRTKLMSFRDTIILAMSEEMRRGNVLLMGEDVRFGGDFGTSRDAGEFGQNVFVTG